MNLNDMQLNTGKRYATKPNQKNKRKNLQKKDSADLGIITPRLTKSGTSTANHGANPREKACAIPNLGTLRAQSGLK